MMFFDQVNNRTDHFRLHHFKNHRASRKFRTVTCMFDRNALTTPVGIVMVIIDHTQAFLKFLAGTGQFGIYFAELRQFVTQSNHAVKQFTLRLGSGFKF